MREIKFRAWDLQFKKMLSHDDIFFIKDNLSEHTTVNHARLRQHFNVIKAMLFGVHHFPLMQYTGLKDKNGKEIYEGDIVKWEVDGDEDKTAEIIFRDLDPENRHWYVFGWRVPLNWTPRYGKCKIIGNIYENPELLGEKT